MKALGVVLGFLLLISPGLAAGQVPAPEAGMPPGSGEAPPVWMVQGPPPFPPPPDGPRLGPGAPAGPGQPPPHHRVMRPGAWWKEPETAKLLGLTEGQVAELEEAHQAHRLRLVELRAELERRELSLQPLLEADRPDQTRVAAALDRLVAARGSLEKERVSHFLAVRRLLSVEQWKRLQTLHREHGPAGRPAPAGRRDPGGRAR